MNLHHLAAFVSLSLLSSPLLACTAFQLQTTDGAKLYCRSMEFGVKFHSNLLVVPRGTTFVGTAPGDIPGHQWKAKYGYVGMNQLMAKTLVSDGLNEKGLVVGALYLPGYTQYEKAGNPNQTMGAWELTSFLLGTCATLGDVREALTNLVIAEQKPAIMGFSLPLHFYVTDKSGSALVIEYLGGEERIFDNPIGVLTNAPSFPWHLTNLGNFINLSPVNVPGVTLDKLSIKGFGQGTGLLGLPGDYTPPSRFVRAALYAKWAYSGKTAQDGVTEGFHILNTFDIFKGVIRSAPAKNTSNKPLPPHVEIGEEITQWVLVHDFANLKTYVRGYDSLSIQMVDLKKIDFTEPGLKEIPMQAEPTWEDITQKAKALTLEAPLSAQLVDFGINP